MVWARQSLALLLPALMVQLFGCSNYVSNTKSARDDFYSGRFSESANKLKAGAHKDGPDQLLFLLDRAAALHHAGQYVESTEEFHLADKISEIKDYTSLATEAATLLSNERIKNYSGEDFEKVLISQYLALNYLMEKKFEDALVECRRVNHKLHLMITEGKKKYKLNPMARYLSGIIYESQREFEDALVDYRETYKLASDFEYLKSDLYRLAYRAKNFEEADHWSTVFGLSDEAREQIRSSSKRPEIVVIAAVGMAPEKKQHELWPAIPKFVAKASAVDYLQVEIDGVVRGRTQSLFSVERTAIENLDDKFVGILAKKIAGIATKEVVADQIGKRTDPLVGLLVKLGLYAADQADLRSWLTLPRDFQVFRWRLTPDSEQTVYKIRFVPMGFADQSTGVSKIFAMNEEASEKLVQVGPNEHAAFVPVRVW